MNDASKKRGRGRPKTTKLDKLRTRVWRHRLSLHAFDTRDKWLWYQIDNYEYVKKQKQAGLPIDEEKLRFSWSKWSSYRNAINTPEPHAGKSSVEEAAKYYPSSELIYRSNIWGILGGQNITADEARSSLLMLDPVISHFVLNAISDPRGGTQEILLSQLSEIPTFETFQAIILMLAWADDDRNTVFWNNICELYRLMLPEFILDGDIPYCEELFLAVDEIAKMRHFLGGILPEDISQCWEDELPRYRTRLVEHYAACLKWHDAFLLLPEDVFTDKAKYELATFMVDIVWENDETKFNAKELWRPLGEFCFKILRGYYDVQDKHEDEIRAMALKELRDYFRTLESDKRSCDTPFRFRQEDQEPLMQPAINQSIGLGFIH